ncbi:spore germination protein [Metabacillus iocasae]|uniref:Spore germination protein KA n=1 Tax=Priestia iocasae TaxID=2291674 RepID=A0ABS2QT35_9BACI|nr:spore germination protein [Metabacillus iocasae]MBM7702348.1 spore germination protein KA [Metabacillus iocasae]
MKSNEKLEERVGHLLRELGNGADVKSRYFRLSDQEKAACMIYIEGIVDTASIQDHIVDPLLNKHIKFDHAFIDQLIERVVETALVEKITDKQAPGKLLEGFALIVVDQEEIIIAADTVKWQERSLSSPKGQRALQGPDLGFTESRGGNVALVRKWVKNADLRHELTTYGDLTNTTVSLLYIEGIVEPDILNEIKAKLASVALDSVLDSNYIAESITKEAQSIFPLTLNSDRPDVVAAEILEGRVCIIVDGSPYALIAPAVLVQFFQSADDYYLPAPASRLIRRIRFLLFWLSVYIPGTFVAFTTFHAGILPVNLLVGFVAQREAVPFPTFLEVLVVDFLIQAILEASNRLPQNVSVTISLFGAIVFGQSSVEAQLIQPITLVVLSVSFILSSIIPIATMSYATRILRVAFILIGALLGLYGIALLTLLLLVHLCYLRSFGVPYLAPFAPFTLKDQRDTLIRNPIPTITHKEVRFHKEEPMDSANQVNEKEENDS